MAVIFRLSSIPGSNLPGGYSTLGHFVVYAILGALLALALKRDYATGTSIALAVLIASAYGATDEFHQHFVAMRTPDIVDWGVDTIGALIGAACASTLAAAAGARVADAEARSSRRRSPRPPADRRRAAGP